MKTWIAHAQNVRWKGPVYKHVKFLYVLYVLYKLIYLCFKVKHEWMRTLLQLYYAMIAEEEIWHILSIVEMKKPLKTTLPVHKEAFC